MRMSQLVRGVWAIANFFHISDEEALVMFFNQREQWAVEELLFGDS